MVSRTIEALRIRHRPHVFVRCKHLNDMCYPSAFPMHTRLPRLALVMIAILLSAASCRGLPAGPSLSNVTVGSLTLEPTIGNPGLCCCRVVGSVSNNNEVPIHATLKIDALDDRGESMARILYFVPDLEPRTSRSVDAHGFIFPCNAIRQLKTEVDVKGLTFPPL
jgi:hypothetical protein